MRQRALIAADGRQNHLRLPELIKALVQPARRAALFHAVQNQAGRIAAAQQILHLFRLRGNIVDMLRVVPQGTDGVLQRPRLKNRPVIVVVQEGHDADSCHALTSIAKVRYHYSILLRWKQTKPRNPLDKRRESAYNGVGIYDCTLSSHFSSVTSSSKPMPARTSSCTSSGKSLSGTPSSRTSASASP